jgi:molecular chaperone GrpE (heat shock protein)
MKNTEDNKSKLKQKEIQFELEKTRLFAQIKECENLVSDWMDRVRTMQEDISKNNTNLVEQIGYMDRWYREEETETQAFLQTLQNTLDAIDVVLAKMGVKEAA